MKFLNVISALSRMGGGVFYAVSNLVKALKKREADVEVLGLYDQNFSKDKAQWGEVPLHVLKSKLFLKFGYAPGLFDAVTRIHPSLIHSHGLWMYPSLCASRWGKKTGKPVVISPHGMLDTWALKNSRLKKKLALFLYENKNLRQCGCFHALCFPEYQSIRNLGFTQPVAIIPNGIEMPVFNPNTKGNSKEPQVLLYVGRIREQKNLLALMKAWKDLPVNFTRNWRLRLAGWGDEGYKNKLSLLVDSKTTLEGPLYGEEKETAFRNASGFILPSLSEGLPIAVLEAWSYGLPVIMSKESNIPEGFKTGAALETGTSQAEISMALEHFLKLSDSERMKMGAAGRNLAEEQFSWEKIAFSMVNVYEWLLNKAPKPDCVMK